MRRYSLLLCLAAACADAPDLETRPPWAEGPALPGRRLEAAVAAHGVRLAVAGGFSTSAREGLAITNEVLVLDTFTGVWEPLPELPVAWTHGSLASVGGVLYLLGGLDGANFIARGDAFALDLEAAAWRALPPLPAGQERGAAGVVVSPPHIYLIGGAGSNGAVLATVLDFNVSTSTWTQLADLPIARSHAAAMRRPDGTLIVAGGLAADGAALADVYALPLGATEWIARAPMPTPRGGCAYGAVLGWLVCVGGEAASTLRVAEAYDPVADAWRALPEMPDARAGAPGAVIGQQLYIAGGSRTFAFEPTDTVYVFSLLDVAARPWSVLRAIRAAGEALRRYN